MADPFDEAAALLQGGDDSGMAGTLLVALPVTGASISTLGPLLGSETVSASDRQVARLDELQFDLREGPCWEAGATGAAGRECARGGGPCGGGAAPGAPVSERALLTEPRHDWPAFTRAVRQERVG